MLLHQRRKFRPISLDTSIRPFEDTGICEKCKPKKVPPFQSKEEQHQWMDTKQTDCPHTNQHNFYHHAISVLSKVYCFQAFCMDPKTSSYHFPSNANGLQYYGGLSHGLIRHLRNIKDYISVCQAISPFSLGTHKYSKRFQIIKKRKVVQYISEEGFSCETTLEYFKDNVKINLKRKRDTCSYGDIVLNPSDHLIIFAEWLEYELTRHTKQFPRPRLPSFDLLLGTLNTDRCHDQKSPRFCALDCLLDTWILDTKRVRRTTNNQITEEIVVKGCSYFSFDDFILFCQGRKPIYRESFSRLINTATKKRSFLDYIETHNKMFDYSQFSGFTIPEDGKVFQEFIESRQENQPYVWCMSF